MMLGIHPKFGLFDFGSIGTLRQKMVCYSPDRVLSSPASFCRDAFRDLWRSRELAWRLMLRDIKAQYRMSCFGYIRALLPPLVLTLTFVLLRQSGSFSTGEIGMPYVVFAITGRVLWQSFADALNGPLQLVSQSREMLVKINFPREALIISALGQAVFNSLLRLVVLVPVLAYEGICGGWGVGTPPTLPPGFSLMTSLVVVFLFLAWILFRISLLHLTVRLGM